MSYQDDHPEYYEPGTLSGSVSADSKVILLAVDARHDAEMKKITDALRHLTAMPKTFKTRYDGRLHVPLTWAIVTQLAKIAEERGFKWKPEHDLSEWIVAEFTKRFTEEGDMKFDVSDLDRTPMPHQSARAYVAALNERYFFADEMGAGKTAAALLTLAELKAQGKDAFPAIVVCPAAVIDPWMEEIQDWGFDFNATVYGGPRRKNLSARYDIYIMSWDVFRIDMQKPKKQVLDINGDPLFDEKNKAVMEEDKNALPPLIDFFWEGEQAVPRTLILDEAHALCNTTTKQSVAAGNFAKIVKYVFPLSGTPITRNISGFFRALNVLDIHSFPDKERYKARYLDRYKDAAGFEHEEGLSSVNGNEFHTLLQGSMGRVAKADILKDLPPKRYSVRYAEMPVAYRAAYREMEEDLIAHIPDTDEPLPVMSTLAQLTRLAQLASSSCDVQIEMKLDEKEDSPTFGMEVPHYNVTAQEPSWKVTELMGLLDEMQGSPLVAFSPSTQLMKLAGARAENDGYKVGYIIGGQSKTQRTSTRKAFQRGELDLLCANTAAGGVGLTLTAADTLVFLSRPFSFTQSAQAEDRIHRRGQEKEAHIIDILCHDTIDTRVREVLRDKAKALSDLVRDPRIVRDILGGK
jgi:SNF2 family DNA or RNA helicase